MEYSFSLFLLPQIRVYSSPVTPNLLERIGKLYKGKGKVIINKVDVEM